MEDLKTCGQILGLGSNSEISIGKDSLSSTRSIKSFKKKCSNKLEPSTNGIDNSISRISNLEPNERLNMSTYCGWSTPYDTTSSSNIYSTSAFNCKSQISNPLCS